MAFPTNCNPRIIKMDYGLTRASVTALTPDAFEALAMKESGLENYYANCQLAKAAGYIEKPLEALLNGRMKPIGKDVLTTVKIPPSGSVILPYIARRQKQNINANYWRVVTGAVNASAGSGGVPSSAWDLTVAKTLSPYATNLEAPQRYFPAGKYVLVSFYNATTKASYLKQFKIISAVNDDSGGVYRAKVTLEPNLTETQWASMTALEKAVYQPTTGIVTILANSVSDYESYKAIEPSNNNQKLLIYWLQNSRFVHEYDDEFLKVLNAGLMNKHFTDFASLPLAERYVQEYAESKKAWVNSILFGQRINENQTREGYTALPTVTDPNDPTVTFEYKCNALGLRTQLDDCGRIADFSGQPLNLDTLFQIAINLRDAREADGKSEVTTVDWMTNRWCRGQVYDVMHAYFKGKYGIVDQRDCAANQVINHEGYQPYEYDLYQLPPEAGGIKVAVYSDRYFDHLAQSATSMGNDQLNRMNTIWGIDWSDVEVGMAGSNKVLRNTNLADELYRYVMTVNNVHTVMESQRWSVIMEDPSRHYIAENFTNTQPPTLVGSF